MTTTTELVKLELDSLRTLLFTQQNFALLRDPISGRGLPIRLTQGEAEALAQARPMRLYKDTPQIPQDLSLRLLVALGAQVQQIVINTLAEQAFYATLTFLQGGQSHELDVRLSEALIVAGYTEAPIYVTRALMEATTQLDLSSSRNVPEMQELVEKAKNVQQFNREERLSLEESLRTAQAAHNRKKIKKLPERLWPFLLEGLTGSRSDISLAELRAIDPVTAFTPREIVWDEQPMTAIKLPDEHEALWLLVRPEIWNEITRGLGNLQQTEPAEKQAAEITPTQAEPLAEPLAEAVKQKVEERLAQLVASDELRTALLLNPKGELIVWSGPDSQETLLQFTVILNNDLAQHRPFANERELNRQLGHQPKKATFYNGNKKAVMDTLPPEIGGVMITPIYQEWKLVVIFAHKPARDLGKDIHQRIHQVGHDLTEIFSQA
jgi:bifunctional DNase/RNase